MMSCRASTEVVSDVSIVLSSSFPSKFLNLSTTCSETRVVS